jgi:tetratricopeptide (TPR) repeat protein
MTMSWQRQTICFLILIVASGISLGQKQTNAGEADRTRLDELRRKGYDALFNLDYAGARRSFEEMVQFFPEHPAGPQCLAANLWLQELNKSRQLQATLYSTDSFNARPGDQTDQRTIDQFHRWIMKARSLAEARLRHNPRDVEALYFLGVTQGLNAVFAAAIERRYFAALGDGFRSISRHREVLKLDPSAIDAELTIGMYDYIVGSLPLPVRILASIGNVRGSKKRGLQTLERVAREGHWARDIASVLLIDLYKREKRWDDALAISRELASRFSGNYIFRLQTADTLIARSFTLRQSARPAEALSDEFEAFNVFESLLRFKTSSESSAASCAPELIHFRYGEALLVAGQAEHAAKEFLLAAAVEGSEPGLATMAHLRAAQSMDIAGKRSQALVEYKIVVSRPNIFHAHEEARRGLREPFVKSTGIKR